MKYTALICQRTKYTHTFCTVAQQQLSLALWKIEIVLKLLHIRATPGKDLGDEVPSTVQAESGVGVFCHIVQVVEVKEQHKKTEATALNTEQTCFLPVAGKLRRWSETFSSIPLRSNPFALPGPFVLSLWLLTQTAFFFSHPSFLPSCQKAMSVTPCVPA